MSDEPPPILPIPPGPLIYLIYPEKSIKMEDFDDFSYTLKKVKR